MNSFAVPRAVGYNVFVPSTGRHTMKALMEAAAKKFGVPAEVLDLIGRRFISQLIDEWPDLLLPPIMQTLHREYLNHGIDWIRQNVKSLQDQFLLLKKLYGPTWILA